MSEGIVDYDQMETASYLSLVQEYRGDLQKILKPGRYEHSLSVSFTCICLAMRYGISIRKAEIAGLIHDCAKQFSNDELIALCRKNGVALTEEQIQSPQVIHSLYGPTYAQQAFHVTDPEVLSAVYYHTLGKPAMSMLEKIVFTADYIEARRDQARRLPELRKLAFTDLDRCIYEINKDTIEYLEKSGKAVCRDTMQTYVYYKQLIDGHQEEKNNGD